MSLIKTEEQISKIKVASKIVALVHKELKLMIKPGISLLELDAFAEELIISKGGKPTFKGYEGFPASLCTSVNDQMVHGIPNSYILKDGDIISVDVGVEKDGWNGDAAFTVGVGKISKSAQKLITVTENALYSAIKFSKPGVTIGELGAHIETFALKSGFGVAHDYVGHGIGEKMHEDPLIPNFGFDGGEVLKENMTLCIEPMFIDGKDELFIDPKDEWTVKTKHGGNASHVEHTIVIRKRGGEILSKL